MAKKLNSNHNWLIDVAVFAGFYILFALLPAPARSYMATHHPDGIVYEIKRDKKGYVVELGGEKVKIRFDTQGNYIKHKSPK